MVESLQPLTDDLAICQPVYRCSECESLLRLAGDGCPECGGETEKANETHHTYWFL